MAMISDRSTRRPSDLPLVWVLKGRRLVATTRVFGGLETVGSRYRTGLGLGLGLGRDYVYKTATGQRLRRGRDRRDGTGRLGRA